MDFKTLYEAHKNLVYNLALQYVQNVQDAEEITQDVFVSVHQKLHTFKRQADIKTWLYRITINKSLDFLKARKSQKRRVFFFAKSINDEERRIDLPHFNHPGVELEQREAMEAIFRAINQLPEKQKTAVILLKIEQMSQAEAAAIMGLSPKAVESLFQRAKKKLKSLLDQNEGM